MNSLPYWKQVSSGRWVCCHSEYALKWCPVNSHFVAYRAGRPLFQCLTLAAATEALHDLLDARAWEEEL